MPPAQVQQRRSNKRGLATREAMLDAAVRSLGSGDPGAVSASRIAKESGATWGAEATRAHGPRPLSGVVVLEYIGRVPSLLGRPI